MYFTERTASKAAWQSSRHITTVSFCKVTAVSFWSESPYKTSLSLANQVPPWQALIGWDCPVLNQSTKSLSCGHHWRHQTMHSHLSSSLPLSHPYGQGASVYESASTNESINESNKYIVDISHNKKCACVLFHKMLKEVNVWHPHSPCVYVWVCV